MRYKWFVKLAGLFLLLSLLTACSESAAGPGLTPTAGPTTPNRVSTLIPLTSPPQFTTSSKIETGGCYVKGLAGRRMANG